MNIEVDFVLIMIVAALFLGYMEELIYFLFYTKFSALLNWLDNK